MPLDERGEFGLIARILERLGEAAALDIAVPPGDDAAAWAAEPGLQIATVDAQVEGTHWRRDTMSLADVGWRAVATAVSDLAAMGARASYVLIAAELGPGLSAEDLDAFAEGAAASCRCHGVRVAGGNVAAARATSFTTTAFGSAAANAAGSTGGATDTAAVLRRDAARAGHLVAVSGTPGAAAAGLALIEAHVSEGITSADAALLIEAHRRPRARLALGQAALATGVRCAIDLSDGLLQDLGHIARASHVGIEIEAAALPLHPAAVALLGRERALALALGGGEDYELALTAPAATLDALAGSRPLEPPGPALTRIGRVVAEHLGEVVARDAAGQLVQPQVAGWDQLHSIIR